MESIFYVNASDWKTWREKLHIILSQPFRHIPDGWLLAFLLHIFTPSSWAWPREIQILNDLKGCGGHQLWATPKCELKTHNEDILSCCSFLFLKLWGSPPCCENIYDSRIGADGWISFRFVIISRSAISEISRFTKKRIISGPVLECWWNVNMWREAQKRLID